MDKHGLRRSWPVVAIMTIVLLAASCSSPGESTTGTKTTATSGGTTETPQYGGTLNLMVASDPLGFDEVIAPWWCWTTHMTEDELLTGDWTKGPAGTGQYSWTLDGIYNWDSKAGSFAESWQVLAPNHYVFKVHQGVHFGLDPDNEASRLVNGREATAEDMVYSYLRLCTDPDSYIVPAHPVFVQGIKMTAVDKYTIDYEVPNDPDSVYQIAQIGVDWGGVIAKEVIDKYGDMKDWKVSHGTGPFFLKDFVSGSALSFEKNPDYWGTNPIGPGKGNKLPYVDAVKFFVIQDTSTQQAALRSGKIDALWAQGIDDSASMKQTSPELKTLSLPAATGSPQIFMRTDKPDLPYKDKEVRQALMKATDFKTIVNDMYDGQATYPSFPVTPILDLRPYYLPIEEASAEAQDLYVYDPAKAKQMLAEAGYPNGFKATIICRSQPTSDVDYLSVIKSMWDKVGVNLDIQPVETGVYMNRWGARNHDDMIYGIMASPGTFRAMVSSQGSGGGYNLSYVSDPRLPAAKDAMMDAFGKGDEAEVARIHKEVSNWLYEGAWAVNTPAQNATTFWQPWLKNYHGENAVGILNLFGGWTKYVWVDQALKKSMGH